MGPSNLVTFAKAVPPTWQRMMAKWVGDPETDADFLLSRSPITYIDQIRAPLFVIQGANDPRVVQRESDQIVELLRQRGIDVRYDVYPDEGHGFTKRANELKALGTPPPSWSSIWCTPWEDPPRDDDTACFRRSPSRSPMWKSVRNAWRPVCSLFCWQPDGSDSTPSEEWVEHQG